jgi:chromatin remodeling complex protein RSC6
MSTLKVTKKKAVKTVAPAAVPVVVQAPIIVETPVVEKKAAPAAVEKKAPVEKKKKAAATTTAVVEPPVVVETPIVLNEVIDNDNVIKSEIKKKRIATRESVLTSFDSICQSIVDEITSSKDDKNVNGKSLKFLRNINKNLGTLKKDAGKLIRQRKKISTDDSTATLKDTNKTTSGFLKPVPISNAIAQFTGWSPNELKSRVEVTKFLCNYIKDNNLQNPSDRRQILADAKLTKLLECNNSTPLTYFDMQSHLKKHFPKQVV